MRAAVVTHLDQGRVTRVHDAYYSNSDKIVFREIILISSKGTLVDMLGRPAT